MKTIIITGAGTGMGAATAVQLAKSGYALILIGRRQDKLDQTLQACDNPSAHAAVSADITDPESFKAALNKANVHDREIYGLFANAGIGGENAYGEGDRWSQIMDINLNGTYISIMETLPYLRKSSAPFKHILITSSCLARFGVPNYTAYCTSKAGLLGLTRSLAVELASERILVNALTPGWVETEMAQQGIQLLADRGNRPYEDEYKDQMGYVPLGRMSDPSDIATFVDFLMSEKQTSITGQGLDINNGSWMQ
ncbi:SDR family NAD(P)-dependent oxidoreductase [Sanyastnella coralliicola]|uniref:SDR family NAD(P)-dependent oxidoreductase n=1 Tax=Sanyastnella coralliicola TaxID=3069118 RepID=UPI0027B9A03D|nr:SDR family NAD(P)-dependent oxidoreductase [Longitalea sp. SCSIO 12813]